MLSCRSETTTLLQSTSSIFSFPTSFSSAAWSFGWHNPRVGKYMDTPSLLFTTLVWLPVFASWCVSPWKGSYLSIQHVVTSVSDHDITIIILKLIKDHLVFQVFGHCLPTVVQQKLNEPSRSLWWSVSVSFKHYHSRLFPSSPPTVHILPGWDSQSPVCQPCPLKWKTTNCGCFGPGPAYLCAAVPAQHKFVFKLSNGLQESVCNVS